MDKLDFIKIKNVCSMNSITARIRKQATDWKKIFAKDKSYEVLISKVYKECLKFNNKKRNNLIKDGPKAWTNTKEDMQKANKLMKICST